MDEDVRDRLAHAYALLDEATRTLDDIGGEGLPHAAYRRLAWARTESLFARTYLGYAIRHLPKEDGDG